MLSFLLLNVPSFQVHWTGIDGRTDWYIVIGGISYILILGLMIPTNSVFILASSTLIDLRASINCYIILTEVKNEIPYLILLDLFNFYCFK